jgi:hypothetical protein
MTLGVHQVDGRIAANSAVKIRAAFNQGVDAKKIITDYMLTHPVKTDSFTRDRARARAWALHNVTIDNTALKSALRQHYAEMYVTGIASTYDAWGKVLRTKKGQKQPPSNWAPSAFALGALKTAVDWSKWKPAEPAAAALLRPAGGLEQLLNGIQIKSLNLDKSSYDLLGTQLADGIAIGASPSKLATMIEDSISSPSRALTIALTEGSRAANAATNDAYQALGIEKAEWFTGEDPCDECDPNNNIDGEIRNIDEEFSNGYTIDELPIHPNCRCTTAPAPVDWSTFDYAGSLDAALNADN